MNKRENVVWSENDMLKVLEAINKKELSVRIPAEPKTCILRRIKNDKMPKSPRNDYFKHVFKNVMSTI